jgi:hypothetical protein
MRVGLISCCKEKLDHAAPAEELYCSQLFKLSRQWIIKRAGEWGILSARYGLVMPDQGIEPYDTKLSDFGCLHKERWDDYVHEQLVSRWSEDAVYTVVAGADYRAALKQMPYVEDVLGYWTQCRRDSGMSSRRAAMSIGIIKKYLKEDRNYGC